MVAVAEMALAGDGGARLLPQPPALPAHAWWFGEDQARYVLAVADGVALLEDAARAGIPVRRIGRSGGQGDEAHLTLPDGLAISVAALRAAHERFFPSWMEAPAG